MTPDEFTQWAADLARRMPSVQGWLTQHADTLRLWYAELFADLPLDDCLAVNRQLMADGKDLKPWELDALGARVRHAAREIGHGRHQEEKTREERSQRPSVSRAGSMAAALAAVLKVPPAARGAILAKEMPAPPPQTDGPRARCKSCRDSGMVKVYDPDTVIAAWRKLRGQLDRYRIHTACAACDCPAGEKFANNQRRPLRRLGARLHICTEVTLAGQQRELAEIAKVWEPPSLVPTAQDLDF